MAIKHVSVDLVISKECNMRCRYCCVPVSDYEFEIPEISYIKSRIENIERKFPNHKINYIVLGGEITLLPSRYLKDVIELIKNRERTGFIHLYTNMTIYSDVLDYYTRNFKKIYLRVSLDTIDSKRDSRNMNMNLFNKNIVQYKNDKIIIDSTLDNITLPKYGELQDFFLKLGIDKFKFKFERGDGQLIEYYGLRDKFVKELISQLRKESLFISNYALNTTAIIMIDEYLSISTHNDEYNDRMTRNVFGKIKIPNKEIDVYE